MADEAQEVAALIRILLESKATKSKNADEIFNSIERQLPAGFDRSRFDALLDAMRCRGELVRGRTGHYSLLEFTDFEMGKIRLRSDGSGLLMTTSEGTKEEFYVSKTEMGGAMDGDRVLARHSTGQGKARPGGAAGRSRSGGARAGIGSRRESAPVAVIEILERARSVLVGIFRDEKPRPLVRPDDLRVVEDVFVSPGQSLAPRDGQYVVVQITSFPTPKSPAVGRILEILGFPEDPGIEVEVSVRKFGIPVAFPPSAVARAETFGRVVPESAYAGRLDLRQDTVVTIDGETAKDFDDAISGRQLDRGVIRLGVHIADVGFYVEEGSALDQAALERGTSVYFPGRCVPMLPEALSNGLCSLVPGEDRLTLSVFLDVDENGGILKTEFARSVIRSAARCTYTDVAAAIEGEARAAEKLAHVMTDIRLLSQVADRFARRRRDRGSIDFDLPDADLLLDEFGAVVGIVPEQRNAAHRLIEELMIAANEAVARHLSLGGTAALYRVHESPDPIDMVDVEEILQTFGLGFRGGTNEVPPAEFQRLLSEIRGLPEERFLRDLLLRSQRKALYGVECKGHYALAAPYYCHFTSPIRRYPDLVVHRSLVRRQSGKPVRPEEEAILSGRFKEMAPHCNQTERRSEAAEREVSSRLRLTFVKDRMGEVLPGIISGISPFGVFVLLDDLFVEGMVHVSNLPGDFYRYDEKNHRLKGTASGKVFRAGDPMRVRLFRIDGDRRRLELLPAAGAATEKPKNRDRDARRPPGHRPRR